LGGAGNFTHPKMSIIQDFAAVDEARQQLKLREEQLKKSLAPAIIAAKMVCPWITDEYWHGQRMVPPLRETFVLEPERAGDRTVGFSWSRIHYGWSGWTDICHELDIRIPIDMILQGDSEVLERFIKDNM
jgi:hypothetical protein